VQVQVRRAVARVLARDASRFPLGGPNIASAARGRAKYPGRSPGIAARSIVVILINLFVVVGSLGSDLIRLLRIVRRVSAGTARHSSSGSRKPRNISRAGRGRCQRRFIHLRLFILPIAAEPKQTLQDKSHAELVSLLFGTISPMGSRRGSHENRRSATPSQSRCEWTGGSLLLLHLEQLYCSS
jgi:hypothetical protein